MEETRRMSRHHNSRNPTFTDLTCSYRKFNAADPIHFWIIQLGAYNSIGPYPPSKNSY